MDQPEPAQQTVVALKASEDQVHELRTCLEAERRRSDMLLSEERRRTERAHALERISWQTMVALRQQLLEVTSEHEQRDTHTPTSKRCTEEEEARHKQLEDELEQTRRKLRLSDLKLVDVTREKMDAEKALNDVKYAFSLAEQEWDEANRNALQEKQALEKALESAKHAQTIAEQEWDMAADEARQERTLKAEAEKRAADLATAKSAVDDMLLKERTGRKNDRKQAEATLARAKKKAEAALTTQRRRAERAEAALAEAKKGPELDKSVASTSGSERTHAGTALEAEKRRSQAALAKERERTQTLANALTATEKALAEIRDQLQASDDIAEREMHRADTAIAALAAARERADAAESALNARLQRDVKEEVIATRLAPDTVKVEEDVRG